MADEPRPTVPGMDFSGLETRFPTQAEQDSPSVFEQYGAAFLNDSPIHNVARKMAMSGIPVDPAYKFDEAERTRLRGDLPDDQWLELNDFIGKNAVSATSADFIRDAYLREIENEQKLADAGMGGLATRMLAAVTDPSSLALAFATGGLSHLTKAGALQGALKVGAWSAAENAALETAALQGSATRGIGDVVVSAVGGFALGAGATKVLDGAVAMSARHAQARVTGDQVGEAVAAAGGTEKAAKEAAQKAEDAILNSVGARAAPTARPAPSNEVLEAQAALDAHDAAVAKKKGAIPDSEETRALRAEQADLIERNRRERQTNKSLESAKVANAERTARIKAIDEELEAFRQPLADDEIAADAAVRARLEKRLEDAKGVDDSVGARRATDVTEPLYENMGEQFNIAEDAPVAAASRFRIDTVGILGRDQDGWVRDAARGFAEEGVGVRGYGVVRNSASGRADLMHRTTLTPYRVETMKSFDSWADEQNLSTVRRTSFSEVARFQEAVGDQIRGIDSGSEAVRQAAKAGRDALEKFRVRAAQANVNGMRGVPPNPNYLPRVMNKAAIRELRPNIGESNLVRLVSGAFRSNHPDLEEAVADRIAKGYVKKISEVAHGMDAGMAHGMRTDDVDYLRGVLQGIDGIDSDEIETILAATKKATEQTSRVTRAKQRLDLDETFAMDFNGRTVRVAELFERNAEKLIYQYSRSMSGWIGLAEELNIRSPADYARFLREMQSRGAEQGRDPLEIARNKRRFDFLFNAITGVPLEADPAGLYASTARTLRDFNTVRIAAAFGLAQTNEIATTIATNGFRNVLRQVPELRKMIKRAEDGTLESDLAAEMEAMIAPGVDRILNPPTVRWDEHGFGASQAGGVLNTLDEGLQRAKRLTMDIGGVAPITIALQRAASLSAAQKIGGWARRGRVSEAKRRRMRGMGWSDKDQDAIFEQMRKHAEFRGGKLLRVNSDKWTDADALSKFTLGMHRELRRTIQENDVGATSEWMHTTTGKIFTQFRNFAINAWSKHTLHNIHYHDAQAAYLLMLGTTLGAMQYIAQVAMNEPNKRKRKEKLQVEEIAKAGFQKTGVASLLPMLVDTGSTTLFRGFTGGEKYFAHGRTSGLGADIFGGVATIDLFDKAARVAGLPGILANPDADMNKTDWRAVRGLLPVVGGLHGGNRAIEALEE